MLSCGVWLDSTCCPVIKTGRYISIIHMRLKVKDLEVWDGGLGITGRVMLWWCDSHFACFEMGWVIWMVKCWNDLRLCLCLVDLISKLAGVWMNMRWCWYDSRLMVSVSVAIGARVGDKYEMRWWCDSRFACVECYCVLCLGMWLGEVGGGYDDMILGYDCVRCCGCVLACALCKMDMI